MKSVFSKIRAPRLRRGKDKEQVSTGSSPEVGGRQKEAARSRGVRGNYDDLARAASKMNITENDVVIAVMGVTGTGKSSFIKLLTGFGVEVGHDLESCTYDIGIHSLQYDRDRTIFLIDTPGFDDTHRSDTQVLKDIAYFLGAAYAKRVKLAGIIYLHRITDVRMTGSAAKNLAMFQLLCGSDSMANVVLATSRWDEVKDGAGHQKARAAEKQLREQYWSAMISDGSRMFRHDNSHTSALSVIDYIMNLQTYSVLDIQRQIVDQKRTLGDTPAGQEVQRELFEQKRHHEEELRGLQASLDKALQQGKKEIAETLAKLEREKQDQLKTAADQENALRTNFVKLQEENRKKYEETIRKLEEEKKKMMIESEIRAKELDVIGKNQESVHDSINQLVSMRRKGDEQWHKTLGSLEGNAMENSKMRQQMLQQVAVQERSLTSSILQTITGVVVVGAALVTENPALAVMGGSMAARAWGPQ